MVNTYNEKKVSTIIFSMEGLSVFGWMGSLIFKEILYSNCRAEQAWYIICIITKRNTKQPSEVLIKYRTKYWKSGNHEVRFVTQKIAEKHWVNFFSHGNSSDGFSFWVNRQFTHFPNFATRTPYTKRERPIYSIYEQKYEPLPNENWLRFKGNTENEENLAVSKLQISNK